MTVQLDNVTIRYGRRVAVDGITARIPPGAVGLLGRNGAGKSSILKALLGLVRPSAGRMAILDLPEDAAPDEIRARVGYMPERDGHLPGMSGFEMVSLLGRLSGLAERDAWRRAHEVLYLVGLDEQRYRPVSGYSTGMRQKAKLAAALVHDPQVLFLDEPTNGLDPSGREEMLGLVRQLSREFGKSIVLSTHILQDVEAVCDAVVVLDHGRLVAEGPLQELTRSTDDQYRLQTEPAELPLPPQVPGLEFRPAAGGGYHVRLLAAAGPRLVFAAVHAAGGVVRQLERQRRSLEDVFLLAVAPGDGA